jgi:hypothetical protein
VGDIAGVAMTDNERRWAFRVGQPPTVEASTVCSVEKDVLILSRRCADHVPIRKVNESMFEECHVNEEPD